MDSMFLSANIADLHFGTIEPLTEYNILTEQFTNKISPLPRLDLICINGDIFDHKFMANSDAVYYACRFVDDLVNICRIKGSTLIILGGTASHDAGQLRLFYHYMEDTSVDVRIVETIKFETVKSAKILCIPELYGVDESIYDKYLNHTSWYDLCIIHGTCKGAVYGDNVGRGRLFTPEDFKYCTGAVIAGHVHKPGCFFGYFYYCGCPIRYKFGEEEAKGFILLTQYLDSGLHYVHFEPIESFRYDTIYLDQLVSEDPKVIIDYINDLKYRRGIDYIKVRFRYKIPNYNRTIINNYYRNNGNVFVEFDADNKEIIENSDKISQINNQYSYLMDKSISDFERFVRYVNDSEGSQFISVEQLTELLNDKE